VAFTYPSERITIRNPQNFLKTVLLFKADYGNWGYSILLTPSPYSLCTILERGIHPTGSQFSYNRIRQSEDPDVQENLVQARISTSSMW